MLKVKPHRLRRFWVLARLEFSSRKPWILLRIANRLGRATCARKREQLCQETDLDKWPLSSNSCRAASTNSPLLSKSQVVRARTFATSMATFRANSDRAASVSASECPATGVLLIANEILQNGRTWLTLPESV